MKKCKSVFAIVIAAFLSGCSAVPSDTPVDKPYEIVTEDGGYFLVLDENIRKMSEASVTASEMGPSITFGSMDEMIQDIKTGNFTEDELKQLAQFKTDDDGRTIICDLESVLDAHMPLPYDSKRIRWCGDGYVFHFDGGAQISCTITSMPNKEYAEQYIDDTLNCAKVPGSPTLTRNTVEDRNATVITYTTSTYTLNQETLRREYKFFDHKSICYWIADGGKELFVCEQYTKTQGTDFESAPNSIRMVLIENGSYFYVEIYEPVERPTVEQLAQFNLHEYVETSTS